MVELFTPFPDCHVAVVTGARTVSVIAILKDSSMNVTKSISLVHSVSGAVLPGLGATSLVVRDDCVWVVGDSVWVIPLSKNSATGMLSQPDLLHGVTAAAGCDEGVLVSDHGGRRMGKITITNGAQLSYCEIGALPCSQVFRLLEGAAGLPLTVTSTVRLGTSNHSN